MSNMAPHTARELLWLAAWRHLAAQTVCRWRGPRLGAPHFWAALPVPALAYWGVAIQAATDSLTELIAAPQPLAFVALCAWFYLLFSQQRCWLPQRKRRNASRGWPA